MQYSDTLDQPTFFSGDWEETEEDISRKWNADEAFWERIFRPTRHSMYGIFTYVYHQKLTIFVGKISIH